MNKIVQKSLFLQNLKYQIRSKYEPNYEGSIFETKIE